MWPVGVVRLICLSIRKTRNSTISFTNDRKRSHLNGPDRRNRVSLLFYDNLYALFLVLYLSVRKICWVCYGSEVDEPELEWISPCQCRGATKWVHQLCLQQWVDEKQKGASSVDVSCPQCRFEYQIVYPNTSFLLVLYEKINKLVTSCSPMILSGVAAGSLYWVSFSYGYASTVLALGLEESIHFLGDQDIHFYVLFLPLMPWAMVGLKLLRFEVLLIKSWYWLTPMVYKLINKLPGFGHEPVQEYSFVPAHIPAASFVSRSIVSTVCLPLISSLAGWVLSYYMRSSSRLKRTILVSDLVVVLVFIYFQVV